MYIDQEKRLNDFYAFIDEFLVLFKGQVTLEELERMPYKKAMKMRETRIAQMEKNPGLYSGGLSALVGG